LAQVQKITKHFLSRQNHQTGVVCTPPTRYDIPKDANMSESRLKMVLVTPEIPYNTGAIGRTCVALNLELILIKPYGFSLDEKSVKRAGTTYWKHVRLSEYDSWQDFLDQRQPPRDSLYLFEEFGKQTVYEPKYQEDAYLVFGCESSGLPEDILNGMQDRTVRLPMRSDLVRSLNLANTATAVIYQAMRGKLGG
jgi:tRNA (cytidine/uridine-2'-O-)-methyltransferase